MAIALLKNPDERNDPPRPLMEHFYALRDMFVFMVVSWVICFTIAAFNSRTVMGWLQAPVIQYCDAQEAEHRAEAAAATNAVAVAATNAVPVAAAATPAEAAPAADAAPKRTVRGEGWQLSIEGLDVTAGISTAITIGIWGGTALSFPLLAFAILRFIFPALTRREKFIILSFLVAGTVLFVGGVGLAYSQTLPMLVSTFMSVNAWMGLEVNTLRIDGYIPLVLKTIIAFGLVFQVPLLLFVLGWFGIITSETLRNTRRWAIVIIFILAMVLTPPDPMSQIIMAIPLCLMYEAAVWAVWLKERLSRRA